MRKARVFVHGEEAGTLSELAMGKEYRFDYHPHYNGPEVSRTMLTHERSFVFSEFPPFFEGLLPEGLQLDGLLKLNKIDRNDLFSQLIAVGKDLVGVVTVGEVQV